MDDYRATSLPGGGIFKGVQLNTKEIDATQYCGTLDCLCHILSIFIISVENNTLFIQPFP
jgi:hypothetical protein